MIRNYILVAIRNINRYPTYAAINIIGLSIGIVCSLMLVLFVLEELKVDSQHQKVDRVYRINSHVVAQDTELNLGATMAPMAPTLHERFPEVESFLRLRGQNNKLISFDDKKFYEEAIYIADSSFFSFFNFKLVYGDSKTCLIEPNSIVLSKATSIKLFGSIDPVGETVKIGGDGELHTVTGVLEEQNFRSHIRPNMLISYSSLPDLQPIDWGNLNDHTYLLLPDNYRISDFQSNFDAVYQEFIKPLFTQFNVHAEFGLMPMKSIYLHSEVEDQIGITGDINYIYIFSAIAFFILIVASINYMNLATARSTNRSREVGIRKAMGSYRFQLMTQFMSESFVITTIAILLSSVVTFFLIPNFNRLSGQEIALNFLDDPLVLSGLFGILVLVGFLGGSYPSFFLSGFKPAVVLKGKDSGVNSSAKLRKVLVITQFTISLIMVISTWIVFDQLQYLENKNLGFAKDRVVRVDLNGKQVSQKYEVLRNVLLAHPNIEAVGSGQSTPGGKNLNMSGIFVESEGGEMVEKIFTAIYVDKEYLNSLEIPLIAGRNFSDNITLDTTQSIIVNEEMVRHMGWDNPIGKKFNVIINEDLDIQEKKVVGVIRDFHLRALQEPIHPTVIHNSSENNNMIVRLRPEKLSESIDYMESKWSEIVSNRPFEYTFIEQDFQRQYESDKKRGEVFGLFAIFTILISCLGLFGLASFTAEIRKKEIGIRKAVGAGTTAIVIMMSIEFMKLVAISIVIAFPIAFFTMSQWLEEFAFRTNISPISFLLSAIITILIAFLTVSYHSISSATSSPTNALRE